ALLSAAICCLPSVVRRPRPRPVLSVRSRSEVSQKPNVLRSYYIICIVGVVHHGCGNTNGGWHAPALRDGIRPYHRRAAAGGCRLADCATVGSESRGRDGRSARPGTRRRYSIGPGDHASLVAVLAGVVRCAAPTGCV